MANVERPEPRGGAAVAAMNGELRAKTVEIAMLLAVGAAESSKARYHIGALVAEIDNHPKKYGRGAVRRVALAVGRDANTLYEYAAVARSWSREEFVALAARKNGGGVGLAFSHFVALSRIGQRRARGVLVERALRDSLTVRELSAIVMAKLDAPSVDGGDVTTGLHQIVRTSDGLLERAKGWHSSLAEVGQEKSTPELAELLESAAARQRAVAEACGGYAEILAAQHKRVVKELLQGDAAKRKAKQ